MLLKRLDIIGFKSFADKTSIEFAPGITAVVGPNGSGKSNISDAIRWVLGEQSARNLRGAKMEDVIFVGSETRRSINYCEVSLTLDNSDSYLPVVFDEVTVTRRAYRNGESEYRLNKQVCRLKDIAELFMDSGLGRESYSIIGQGRIEEMLSTRPEDRRGPFEDAAGIVKFKFRKREAEKKLNETAGNILRVNDIIAELEQQVGPLKKEAERAREYQKIYDELTQLDISLLVHDIFQLRARWGQSQEEIQEWNRRYEAAGAELSTLEEAGAFARKSLEERRQALESMQQQLLRSVEARQRFQGQVELLRERRNNAQEGISERAKQQETVLQEQKDLEQRVQSEEARLQRIRGIFESKSAELEIAVNEVNPQARVALENEIDKLNDDLIELHHQAATARNELKQAEEASGDEQRRRERLSEDLKRRQGNLETLQREKTELEQSKSQVLEELSASEGQLKETRNQVRELTNQETSLAGKISKGQSNMAALKSRRDLLRDLEAGYDGYAQGVRFVLAAADKRRISGVHGSVAALIHVQGQYELAIETALGGALQNIVTDDEQSAREAIQLLKQRQAGRATFMPLDVIRSRTLHQDELRQAKAHRGFVNVASELVETQSMYRRIVEHLLGNVIVASNLEAANQIARSLRYRVRIVTVEGDVVNPGGIMSGGGQTRKGPGLLGRSRERSQVEERLKSASQEAEGLLRQQRDLRNQVLKLQEMQKKLDEELARKRSSYNEIESELRELKAREQNAAELYQSVLWEQEQLESGAIEWKERAQEIQGRLTQVEQDLQDVEKAVRAKRSELEARDQRVASFQEHLTGLRVEVATLKQEQDSVQERMADYKERNRRLNERLEEAQTEKMRLEQLVRQTDKDIDEQEKENQHIGDNVAELEATIETLRQNRLEAEQAVQSAEARVRQQQQTVHTMEEQVHRSKVQAERLDVELNHALTRMGEQHKMTYEWAKEHYPAIADEAATRRQSERLQKNLNALGEVQLGAIEEWARLSERMSFLQSERDDLEHARIDLRELITEIDEEMSKRFAATFEQIRTEFQVAFRQLFNGGKADLYLTNPDSLLTSGIEVTVQPPGKRSQNLNLLSGGERALIAMALLFAILRVKPVPFCVLDEVEAALDEANVGRFAQYLRQFSNDSQFIIMTHRRGTMEEADVLYGVTMQESGVSSLIGVKLSEINIDPESA